MPTPPCLVPSALIDLTLPANRLRAAVRLSGAAWNALSIRSDGVHAAVGGGILVRRVADQPIAVPAGGVAVEWDDAAGFGAASWSSLAPEWVSITKPGVWQAWWTFAMVGGEGATVVPSLLGASLVAEDGVVAATHLSSSDFWGNFGAGATSRGPWPRTIRYAGALSPKARPMGVHKWGGLVLLGEGRYRLLGAMNCATSSDGFIAGAGWDASVSLPSFGVGPQSTILSLSFLCETGG